MSFWFEVCCFTSDPSSAQVIRAMRHWLSTFGIPVRLRADNGPQFRSAEFASFLEGLSIQLSLTSPYIPCSNGLADSAVKVAKMLLSKTSPVADVDCPGFWLGLLELRNTAGETGHSPTKIVFGRPTRSSMPVSTSTVMRPDLTAVSNARADISAHLAFPSI
eukprot:snap_masked-scaffold1359_size45765-processed-gene-0.0 protein:Tk03803 transcript:snap_masked-scaffold1359_size45765-processed-gene-0.0-mRNA-1 annotation:"hypothetical protein DAPPUDRAFT_269522"